MLIKTDNTQALYNALDRIKTLEAALEVARDILAIGLNDDIRLPDYADLHVAAIAAHKTIEETLGKAGV